MSSDTSATGEIPALEPEAGPTAPAARQASGLAALAPPARPGPLDRRARPAGHELAGRTTAALSPPAGI